MGYTSECVKKIREIIHERYRLLNKGEQDSEKYKDNTIELKKRLKSFQNLIKKNNSEGFLNKKVIAYIHNTHGTHWTCTFIFNVVSYISKWEYKHLKIKQIRFQRKK